MGRGVPACRGRPLHRGGDIAAEQRRQPFRCERDHRALALRRERAAKAAGDIDGAERRSVGIGKQQRGFAVAALLDHGFVGAEAERIFRQPQRDTVIAAERELRRGIELPLRQVGREADVARRQHVARYRDDDRTRVDAPGRRFNADVAAAPDDPVRRRRNAHWQALAELGEQRA